MKSFDEAFRELRIVVQETLGEAMAEIRRGHVELLGDAPASDLPTKNGATHA